ncbi:MAG: peptide chain release factor 3 [Polyangiaceae bacterium]
MSELERQIPKRRTFAIISHPDAGKTTLTEKLLLFGGAIQRAGAVKARGERRRATSDWMKVEKERGISVASSVMTFEYRGCTFNLLDTPGHQDFSEDTYRTLTAVDSAVMVLDAAKGIEAQTLKLFEVCRLRDVPIITFVNKMDREAREPLTLIDEIEDTLQIEVTPTSWPIGMGDRFLGCFDLRGDRLVLMNKGKGERIEDSVVVEGLDDPKLDELLPAERAEELREGVEMVRELMKPFSMEAYREGNLTPMYFGSALNNFGVKELLDGLVDLAPSPRPQPAETMEGEPREIAPNEEKTTGFVFKIQANMDPKHRDRIAFVRLCSGHFRRGMKMLHPRSGKTIGVHTPLMFLAQDREVAQEAWPGDIIGVPNHGNLAIGDALTEGEALRLKGIPSFAPELLQAVRPVDPMRAKHLGKALTELAEEGAAHVFKPHLGGNWIVGVVGSLQFDVLADRLATEYNLEVIYEASSLITARWVEGPNARAIRAFVDENRGAAAEDHTGATVFLARNTWHLERMAKDYPDLKFLATKEHIVH